MADEQPGGGGFKGLMTRRIGPLPTWAWIAIVAGLIVGYAWWKSRQSSTSSAAGSTDVPEFVNQTYTTVEPPSAPDKKKDTDKDKKGGKDEKPPTDKKPDEPPGQGRPPKRKPKRGKDADTSTHTATPARHSTPVAIHSRTRAA